MSAKYLGPTGRSGQRGEDLAARWLQALGWEILCQNYAGPYGEIDLIAQDGAYIVFVEVKRRKDPSLGLPGEAVTKGKQRRIIQTALGYIQKQGLDEKDFRFDVIAIHAWDGGRIEHIENAFEGSL